APGALDCRPVWAVQQAVGPQILRSARQEERRSRRHREGTSDGASEGSSDEEHISTRLAIAGARSREVQIWIGGHGLLEDPLPPLRRELPLVPGRGGGVRRHDGDKG